jgi:hypothetical protein
MTPEAAYRHELRKAKRISRSYFRARELDDWRENSGVR